VPRDVIQAVVMSGFADKGGSVIAPANEFWHNASLKARPSSTKKAREILAAAGYSWDSSDRLHYPA